MSKNKNSLAEPFAVPGLDEWRALVDKGLRSANFDEVLVRRTADGIARGPLRTAADDPANAGIAGHFPFVRGASGQNDSGHAWHIAQGSAAVSPKAANGEILEDLNGGGSALWLRLDPAGKSGTAVHTLDDMARLLRGIDLALAPVLLNPAPQSAELAALMLAAARRQGLPMHKLRGSLGLSPVGQSLFKGLDGAYLQTALPDTVAMARWCAEHAPALRTITVTANSVHEAGGSEALEIAFAAAGGLSYLKALTAAGLPLETAARRLLFAFAVDADIGLGIAKLRAARRVWAAVLAASGCTSAAAAMQIHAITSGRMMARQAPWTNLLRTTTATFAAIAGGAHYISVLPHDDAVGGGDARARRVARNVQIILGEEVHAGRVIDPAGGSFALERLSDDLARKAWTYFQQIESLGGLASAKDWLAQTLAAQREHLCAQMRSGARIMVGVNRYRQKDETAVPMRPPVRPPAMPEGPGFPEHFSVEGYMAAALEGAVIVPQEAAKPNPAFAPMRLAADFEEAAS